MKKLFSLLMVAMMVIGLFAGCGTEEEATTTTTTTTDSDTTTSDTTTTDDAGEADSFVVGYTNLADTDVFCMERENQLIELTKDIEGLEIIFTDANNDINKQLNQIDNFIAQGVDAIIVVPVDYDGIVSGVEKANDAGIPVLALGIESNGGDYCFIGSTNVDAGRMQGEWMAENLPENAQILILEGQSGLYHSKERKDGFMEVIEALRPDVEVLNSLDGKYARDEGMRITEDWVQTYPEFDAIVAANDQMALGAIEALEVAGRLDGVLIAGVDGVPDALTAIEEGKMALSIFQNGGAQAGNAAEVIEILMAGGELPSDIIIPFESITAENVQDYK